MRGNADGGETLPNRSKGAGGRVPGAGSWTANDNDSSRESSPGTRYSNIELMICIVARLMENGKMAFIGTGIPMLAAALAKKLHAPQMEAVFEFGGTDPVLDRLPLNVGAQQTFHRAVSAISLADVMEAAQKGFLDLGFVGAAQIDPFGNINTTVIGDHSRPKVRLPGSGGGCDIGALCWRTVAILAEHDLKRFVGKVDFITTPGFLDGPGARERAGLPGGTGPYRVVTPLAVMDFDETSRRMRLLSLNPGVTMEDVRKNTGFELVIPKDIGRNPPPAPKELQILRKEVDPHRLYI